jgi:hypothetical protein
MGAQATEDRRNQMTWLLRVGWPLLLLEACGTLYVVLQSTVWTWRGGPQMIGFTLAHRWPMLFLLTLVVHVVAHVWLLAAAAVLAANLMTRRPVRHLAYAVLCGIVIVGLNYVPGTTWCYVTVQILGPGPRGPTLLIYAAAQGDLRLCRLLMSRGVGVDARTEAGDAAILAAARSGRLAVLHFLMSSGADVNTVGSFGQTAIRGAAENGHTAVVRALLEKGADTSKVGPGGLTAIDVARRNGHHDIVAMLSRAEEARTRAP